MRAVLAAICGLVLGLGTLSATPPATAEPDPDWVFYSKDKTRYRSPWYAGRHRVMIPFGCTRAPYYAPDPRCQKQRGFHHGIDVALPCGTRLTAGRRAWVASPSGLGSAYGEHPLLLRNFRDDWDLVLGHARRVFVEPGDRVRRGQVIARASDSGAPDGCHLHFEQRAVKGGLSTAVKPRRLLHLRKPA